MDAPVVERDKHVMGIERQVIVSVYMVWDGTENNIDDRARPGLYNKALSVQSSSNHLEKMH